MSVIRNILNSRSSKGGNFFNVLTQILGFRPKNISHYKRAFTHRSLNKKDADGNAINFERLEFLGDAMLSAVVASHLFKAVPGGNEGYLTKMRSKVVSRKHLNELGKDLRLIDHIETNIPKEQFGVNVHGNLFEALVGAIYLDKGYKYCKRFIYERVIDPYVDIEQLEGKVISYKSLLIEWCQKEKKEFDYEVYEDTGRDELKHFGVKLRINDRVVAKARATSKKKAEEKASKRAYYALQNKME
ncbi:MAG: ribonuclease III [Bacteroidota bacterium]|uniref:Ribonuclease 3 n=1 Tax=Christiangramia flava JLT2011 TaxID=1229726 RepID=A0A1L7I3N4_9FLAO|nr:ribonuclease III [Christiangramia flava]APU68217.1 Ribonuclease III [Christiangramia flava JLT2011]MAM19539.1 ribonuclease III [Christiangramia sp.]MEE2773078.1 ribonuclease III [Bacteroidota bacterium]OSS40996.1 Ribonuclease III [Christiangramia flava JLT2011]